MAKSKKLTLASIYKANSALNEKKQIKVLGEYDVLIHQTFRKSLIKKVILSYFKVIQQLKALEDATDETIANSIALLNVFIVHEFSDVPIPDVTKLEDLVQVANVLLDTGVLEEVLKAFDPTEMEKINEEMKAASKNIGEVLAEIALQQSFEESGDPDAIVQ